MTDPIRIEHNLEILDILAEYVSRNPELRFGQILAMSRVIQFLDTQNDEVIVKDPFFEESESILKRVKEYYEKKK